MSHNAESDAARLFTADEVIEIANETSDSLGNLYRLDFIDRIRHEASRCLCEPDECLSVGAEGCYFGRVVPLPPEEPA